MRHAPDTDMAVWVATTRYGLRPAPGGLALVEDFLNTRASCLLETDLLDDVESAQARGSKALCAWSTLWNIDTAPLRLTDNDVAELRELRTILETVLTGAPVERSLPGASPQFNLTSDGRATLQGDASGWRGLWASILSEIMLSQHAKTWRRLKLDRDPSCHVVYQYRSWDFSS